MNYIKARFLKGNKPLGRAYTYRIEEEVKPGDIVTDAKGSKLVVVGEADMEWVDSYGKDKVATVKKCDEPDGGMLKIGDKVVMNGKYYVSESNKNRLFTVNAEPREVCGTLVVWLEGYSGCYAVDGLNKYDEPAAAGESEEI